MKGTRARRAPGRAVSPQGLVQDVTPPAAPWVRRALAAARLAGPRHARIDAG